MRIKMIRSIGQTWIERGNQESAQRGGNTRTQQQIASSRNTAPVDLRFESASRPFVQGMSTDDLSDTLVMVIACSWSPMCAEVIIIMIGRNAQTHLLVIHAFPCT